MTVYEITMQCNQFFDYIVEADSKEEALNAIKDGSIDHCDEFTDYDTQTVHSIEEETNA
tara:strand:+ start:1208 stop:1384 length:177 start_codon:yes stop_codon:yes gene_type:complete